MRYNVLSSQSGLSIIATVMVMMILALFAAVAVSLVTTGSSIGLQEEQGVEAFYIAEGGMHYAAKKNFPNHDVSSAVNLGSGSFTTSVPKLKTAIGTGDTQITVLTSTDGFLQAAPPADTNYWIMLCDTAVPAPDLTASSTCEKISFTTKTPSATEILFTSGTRERDSSTAASHLQNAVILMYSWDAANQKTLARNVQPSDNCTTPNKRICLNNTTGLASSGFIRITDITPTDIEDVFYNGIGTTVAECGGTCTACLGTVSCVRKAFNGNGNGYNHNNPATDLVYQSEISALTTSTGVIPNILSNNVTRRVQGALMPLK